METIISKAKLDRLVGAVANLQTLHETSVLADAYMDSDPDSVNLAVAAFDALYNATTLVQADQKAASPFLRYRREIMAETPAGVTLRCMVLSLYRDLCIPLRTTIATFGEHETRVMLECIASFATHGDRDSQFMGMAMEIAETAANSFQRWETGHDNH